MKPEILMDDASCRLLFWPDALRDLAVSDFDQAITWRQDTEAALGREPDIASVSLGATRRFLLKQKDRDRRLELELPHGSLLLMAGRLQEQWVHALPKTRKPAGLRINFTFRLVNP